MYLHCNNRLNDVISVHTVLRCKLDTITTNIPEHTNVPWYGSEMYPNKASVNIHERIRVYIRKIAVSGNYIDHHVYGYIMG